MVGGIEPGLTRNVETMYRLLGPVSDTVTGLNFVGGCSWGGLLFHGIWGAWAVRARFLGDCAVD
jgi:hypothetical protein